MQPYRRTDTEGPTPRRVRGPGSAAPDRVRAWAFAPGGGPCRASTRTTRRPAGTGAPFGGRLGRVGFLGAPGTGPGLLRPGSGRRREQLGSAGSGSASKLVEASPRSTTRAKTSRRLPGPRGGPCPQGAASRRVEATAPGAENSDLRGRTPRTTRSATDRRGYPGQVCRE